MIARLPDWEARLVAFMISAEAEAALAGLIPCAAFTLGAVRAMAGAAALADLGTPRTRTEGLRRLRALGHDDHIAFIATRLRAVDPVAAAPGDVAFLPGEAGGEGSLGIVQGPQIYTAGHGGRLVLRPRAAMIRAWAL